MADIPSIVGWITIVLVGVLLLALLLSALTSSIAGVTPHPEGALDGTHSIGDLIEDARNGGPVVHIIFVHGIRADGPGTSDVFQAEMRRQVHLSEGPRPPRHHVDLGPPPPALFAGQPVWTPETWKLSRPFVDRRVYADGRAAVIVDEVNWWPLVFPLKGRYLLLPEIDLAGPDREHLDLCAKGAGDPPPNTFWSSITKAQIADRIRHRPRKSGGAPINAALKQQLVDWGFADAVIALGPIRNCYRTMMDGVFEYAEDAAPAEAVPPPADKIFVIVSESLGSFIVMDVLSAPPDQAETAKRALLERTFDLYFFANQFSLLTLARLWDGCLTPTTDADTAALTAAVPEAAALATSGGIDEAHRRASPMHALALWSQGAARPAGPALAKRAEAPRQIIAFNDPSDALTFEVPEVPGAKVANVYDRNSIAWLWLFENPVTAHTGHSQNRAVMRTLFHRTR
jgi:hypothetical protein